MSPRETILRRRARFCAIALAGVGLAACGDDGQALPSQRDTEAAPEACLWVIPDSELLDSTPVDALPETREDATETSDSTATDATSDSEG